MADMQIAVHVLGTLSALSKASSVLSATRPGIISDATNAESFSSWVELKMVAQENWRSHLDSTKVTGNRPAVLVSNSWILTRIMNFLCLNDPLGESTCARSTLSNWVAIIGDQQRKLTEKVLNSDLDSIAGIVLVRLDEAIMDSNIEKSISVYGLHNCLETGKEMVLFWKQYKNDDDEMMKRSTVYVTPCGYPEDELFCASASLSEDLSLMENFNVGVIGGSPLVVYHDGIPYLGGILIGYRSGTGSEDASVDAYVNLLGKTANWIKKVTKSTINT